MSPFRFASILACVATFVCMVVDAPCGEPGKDVRPILFKATNPDFFTVGGQSKVIAVIDRAALEALIGQDAAKNVMQQVDLAKEQLTLVSWTTSGPPDGSLRFEIKGPANQRELVFYVQGPPGAAARGQRARIGADLYAAPKDLKISFDPKERP